IAPTASVTCTTAENVLLKSVVELYVLGVPEMSPVAGLILSPIGSAPAGMLHVYGGKPPDVDTDEFTLPTCICTEYGVLTCATPSEAPSCRMGLWLASV